MLPSALEQALAAAIREPNAAQALRTNDVAFLRQHGVNDADIAASGPELGARFLLYRELVQRRLVGVLEVALPRTVECLGAERVERAVAEFLGAGAARSPYLRDVASEFVGYASRSWSETPELPACLAELAAHELLLFELAAAADVPRPQSAAEVSLGSRLQAACPLQLVHYHYAVHRVPSGAPTEQPLPAAEPVSVLVYRDAEQRVRCLELTPLGTALLRELLQGETLGSATERAFEASGTAASDVELAAVAALLHDLEQRGILSAGV